MTRHCHLLASVVLICIKNDKVRRATGWKVNTGIQQLATKVHIFKPPGGTHDIFGRGVPL